MLCLRKIENIQGVKKNSEVFDDDFQIATVLSICIFQRALSRMLHATLTKWWQYKKSSTITSPFF